MGSSLTPASSTPCGSSRRIAVLKSWTVLGIFASLNRRLNPADIASSFRTAVNALPGAGEIASLSGAAASIAAVSGAAGASNSRLPGVASVSSSGSSSGLGAAVNSKAIASGVLARARASSSSGFSSR